MPDVSRKSISASQIAALWDQSPYITKRMLFDWAHDHLDIDAEENDRMRFGKLVQPFILDRTQDEFSLEVVHNEKDVYVRHPKEPIGATRDAHLVCPSRGRGVVEAKSVSYITFRNDWSDNRAPAHIESQVQCQMFVEKAEWAVIAIMIGANEDMRWMERRPDFKFQKAMVAAARAFFDDVKKHRRPLVYGSPAEMPGLMALYPEAKKGVTLDLSNDADAGDLLRRYAYHRRERLFHSKNEDELKIRIIDLAKDAGHINAYGASATITKTKTFARTVRQEEGTRIGIKVEERENVEPLPEVSGFTALDA